MAKMEKFKIHSHKVKVLTIAFTHLLYFNAIARKI